MSRTSVTEMKRGALKRVLGVFDLFAIGFGDLGSSIFYALGVTAFFALGATPLALGLAGIVFVCTALSYAEMTSIYQESGGSASFARHAFNDLVSFIAGWGLLLDYIVTIAISLFAVGPYLSYFFVDLQKITVQIVFTLVLISLLCVLNVIGVKESSRVSLVLTAFTLLLQAVIIVIGLGTILNLPFIFDHLRIGVPNVDWSPTGSQFIKGVAMAMVAYTGIESIAQLAAESKSPVKTVPRAILLTMIVLLLTYLGITAVIFSAISSSELGTTYLQNPITAIVNVLPFGQAILSPLVAILAAVVLTTAANAGLIGASRLIFNLGGNYQLPRFFYWLHPRLRTPVVALIVFSFFAFIVVVASRGHLDFIADLYNVGAMSAFFFAHLSLLVLRVKQPDLKRPFRAPLNISFGKVAIPLTALIGAVATLSVWFLVMITKPHARYLGIGWMILGVILYLLYRKKKGFQVAGSLQIEKIEFPDFKPHTIRKILLSINGLQQTDMIQAACTLAKMHNAELTAIHLIEISPVLPLDMKSDDRLTQAEDHLKRVKAIAHEVGVTKIELEIQRSRSSTETLLELTKIGKYDLLILGASGPFSKHRKIRNQVLHKAPCPIFLYG
ncbi:MAG TPA: universal stress protein [Chlamydiales bacterium]|nr:universal stress protein [Chlamydiales bacterium]